LLYFIWYVDITFFEEFYKIRYIMGSGKNYFMYDTERFQRLLDGLLSVETEIFIQYFRNPLLPNEKNL